MKKKYLVLIAVLVIICAGVLVSVFVRNRAERSNSETTDAAAPSKASVVMNSDFYYYEDAEELCKKADAVLIGEITDKKYENLNISDTANGDEIPYTVYTMKVSRCFKGNAEETYYFKVLGGETSDMVYEYQDGIEFETGSQYLIAVEEYENGVYASLLNPVQAAAEYNPQSDKITFVGAEISLDDIAAYCQKE